MLIGIVVMAPPDTSVPDSVAHTRSDTVPASSLTLVVGGMDTVTSA